MDSQIIIQKYKLVFKGLLRNNEEWLELFDKAFKLRFVRTLANLKGHYSKQDYHPSFLRTLMFLKHVRMSKARVVIVADPEPDTNGFCLGTRGNNLSVRQQLVRDLSSSNRVDPTFGDWVTQGVILMPSSFTVGLKAPKNHRKMWKTSTQSLAYHLDEAIKPVWCIFGKQNSYIADSLLVGQRDMVMEDLTEENLPVLKQKDPFGKINSILTNFNKEPIRW